MYTACDTWYEVSCRRYENFTPCPGDAHLNWKERGVCTVLELLQVKFGITLRFFGIHFCKQFQNFISFQNKEPNNLKPTHREHVDVESKVLLNKIVTNIAYNAQSNASNRIKVKCSDGSIYFADHLICTVSLGVLKKFHLTWFEPCLPLPKIISIEGSGFNTVDKLFVEFSKTFWTDEWLGVSILWQPEQLKEIRSDPVNGDWLEHILGFYPISFQPNILIGWISGAAAKKMEQVNDDDFQGGIRLLLKMVLKKYDNGEWRVKNSLR